MHVLMIIFRVFLSFLTVFLIVGCSSKPVATAKYHSHFDFGNIESYSLYDRNSKFSEFQNISDATRNSIELAIEQAIEHLGYQYQNPQQADIVIGYHLINSAKELKKYNKGVKFCGPCLREGLASADKRSWQMLPGSLILDVVDRHNNRSIWRSVYPLKIKDNDNSFEVQDKIFAAISAMVNTIPNKLITHRT